MATYVYSHDVGNCIDWMTKELNGTQNGILYINNTSPDRIISHINRANTNDTTLLRQIDYRKLDTLSDIVALIKSNSEGNGGGNTIVIENLLSIVKDSSMEYAMVNYLLVRICQNQEVIILDEERNEFMILMVNKEIGLQCDDKTNIKG